MSGLGSIGGALPLALRLKFYVFPTVSGTMRMLSRTKMFEEGRIMGLMWNGDALEQRWSTPKAQGMIVDFSVDSLSGLSGKD